MLLQNGGMSYINVQITKGIFYDKRNCKAPQGRKKKTDADAQRKEGEEIGKKTK